MEEKIARKFARWDIGREASLKVPGAKENCPCRVQNISLKGLEVVMGGQLQEKRPNRLRLYFSEGDLLNIEGWIVWSKTAEGLNTYGIYFTRISDADKEKIYAYLMRNCPEQVASNMYRDNWQDASLVNTIADRRDFERFPLKLGLTYSSLATPGRAPGLTNDISASGLGLILDKPLAPGIPLCLEVQLTGQAQFIGVEAYVVWSQAQESGRYRVGVKLDRVHFMELGRLLRCQAYP